MNQSSGPVVSNLQGQRALVTAGGSGIGRVIAERLTEAGVSCMVCDVDEASLADYASRFGAGLAVRADVSDEAQVDALFKQLERELGGLDILVNNAGTSGPTGPFEKLALEDWRRTLAINLDGHFLCARRAVSLLRAAGGGSIINMSSIAGRLGYATRAAYSAAKWGIVGFTKTLSLELGPDGIRVNALQPGLVEGPRVERVLRERAEALGMSYENLLAGALGRIPLRRPVTAEDIAAAVIFLASAAGRNITGQAIPIDGGAVSTG
jgi:NAD(P)-dependent dehydrogenase (short-subunit alcohol dehydrogenase family)